MIILHLRVEIVELRARVCDYILISDLQQSLRAGGSACHLTNWVHYY